MQKNQMQEQMLKAARAWLAGRQPEDIAAKARVSFDGHSIHLESLGIPVTVDYPAYRITPQLDIWHELVILHYLHLADGTPLTGQTIPFAQHKDGMIRGGGFDRNAETAISRLEPEQLMRRCAQLGGRVKASAADYCAELPFLPMYPVTVTYWQADEEFPVSGRLLLDRSAEHYLTIEDAVTVGQLLLEMLEQA